MTYYEKIEWELLQNRQIFKERIWNFEFPFEMSDVNEITIYRDEFYNLTLELKCIINTKVFSEKIKQFEMIDLIKIRNRFSTYEILIKNCDMLNYKVSIKNSINEVSILLNARKIIVNRQNSKNCAWIKEWYLNGPNSESIFRRTVTYTKKEIYEKELDNPCPELKDGSKFQIETNEIRNTLKNYIFCKLNEEENIIINKVPDEMNPEWSNNISISYNSNDFIENRKLREDIENIVSFVFGRKLIKIAESHYDSHGNKINEEIRNPFINRQFDIKNICKSGDNFPIPIESHYMRNIELIISKLINSFIEKRETLDFHSMFVNYWNSSFLPPESRIILLAASLESIKNKWFESNNSKSKGVIIDKKEYKNRIKDIHDSFLEEFGDCELLVNNFNQLNKLSINKGFESFFKEIGIEIGDIELEAINARNKPVHGNDIDIETYGNLIVYANVYQILVNRVILTILDFDGNYSILNFISPIPISDKIPFSLEKMRDEIYQLEYYDV